VLRRQVADLRRQLAKTAADTVVTEKIVEVEKIVNVEIPVLNNNDRELLKRAVQAAHKAGEAFALLAPVIERIGAPAFLTPDVSLATRTGGPAKITKLEPSSVGVVPDPLPGHEIKYSQRRPVSPPAPDRTAFPDMSGARNGKVSVPQRKILNALVWFEAIGVDAPRRPPLAAVAGVSSKSSGFRANVSTLSGLGLIQYPGNGRIALTDAGREEAEEPVVHPTVEALHDAVYRMVSGPQAQLLQVLISHFPEPVTREQLASEAGVSMASSGFRANVSTLSGFELLEYPQPGMVKAADLLFPGSGVA